MLDVRQALEGGIRISYAKTEVLLVLAYYWTFDNVRQSRRQLPQHRAPEPTRSVNRDVLVIRLEFWSDSKEKFDLDAAEVMQLTPVAAV